MLTLLALLSLAHATPYVGVDYVPLNGADTSDLQSGTLVAERDGLIQPPLTAWGGVENAHRAWLVGLGVARFTTWTWVGTAEDSQRTRVHVGALRPSLDYRRYLGPSQPGHARGWLSVGVYGLIPSAATVSQAYTDEEQIAMDESSRQDRGRIGGLGERVGGGAEVLFDNGLTLGARYLVVFSQGQVVDDEAWRLSATVATEAALTLGFRFH